MIQVPNCFSDALNGLFCLLQNQMGRLAFSIVTEAEEEQICFVAATEYEYNMWCDGLNALLGSEVSVLWSSRVLHRERYTQWRKCDPTFTHMHMWTVAVGGCGWQLLVVTVADWLIVGDWLNVDDCGSVWLSEVLMTVANWEWLCLSMVNCGWLANCWWMWLWLTVGDCG